LHVQANNVHVSDLPQFWPFHVVVRQIQHPQSHKPRQTVETLYLSRSRSR
jgi:hypothetical protein